MFMSNTTRNALRFGSKKTKVYTVVHALKKSMAGLYYDMRKHIGIVTIALAFLLWLAMAVFAAAAAYEPVGNVVFSIAAGSVYRKVGEAAFDAKGYPRSIAVYKAEHKPFLIVGPCLFHEGGDYEDFFFVNKKQVVRTATDKGGDMWCRTFDRLYIMDDLSDCEILRAPLWDELKHEGSSVRYDEATDSYVYSFRIENDTIPATLTIPAKFFTPDMLDAPNRTLKD